MNAFAETSFLCALYRVQDNSPEAYRLAERLKDSIAVSYLVIFEFRQSVRLQTFRFSADRKQGYSPQEAARLLKATGLEPDRTLQFVWFMGEEQGLVGSTHYVAQAKKRKELGRVKYMLNFDMAGNAKGWNAFGFGQAADYFTSVGKLAQARDTGYANQIENRPGLHSDHQPFMLEGIPVADPLGDMPAAVYNCYHADCDHIKILEPEYLERTARLAALMAYALATEPTLPATRLADEATKQMLIKAGLKEKLMLGKDWKWD